MYNYYECIFLRPKHPIKVHVWAGISRKGRTGICVFEGKMNAELYVEILNNTLLPFIEKVLPDHRLFQDNDPKHTSRRAQKFYEEKKITWWKTPPESPDANVIENLWHELKENIRKTKPRNKEQLVSTILNFWDTVDVAKCNKYINHLKKVIPKMIEVNGKATGY